MKYSHKRAKYIKFALLYFTAVQAMFALLHKYTNTVREGLLSRHYTKLFRFMKILRSPK